MKPYNILLAIILSGFLINCSNDTNKSTEATQIDIKKKEDKIIYSSIKKLKEIDGNWKNDFDVIKINSKRKTFQWNEGPHQRVVKSYNEKNGFRIQLYLGNTLSKDFLVKTNKDQDKLELIILSSGQSESRYYNKVK